MARSDTGHKAVFIRKSKSSKKEDQNTLYLTILTEKYFNGTKHEYWNPVLKISSSSIEDSKERIRRLKIIRTADIKKKTIEYLRFTRKQETTGYEYYLNGRKIDPLDLPAIAEKIYSRREERHKHGKSSQLNETVIFTILDDRILDIDFPDSLESPVNSIFMLKNSICQIIPHYRSKGYGNKR